MKQRRWFVFTALLGALMLVAAACNGDDDEVTPPDEVPEGIFLIGADGLLSDTFVVIPETEGMYLSGPARPPGAAGYDEFVESYQELAGETPIQAFHAHAYDAATILLNGIADTAEAQGDGSLVINTTDVMNALYDLDGFQGLTGTLTCNAFGDCAEPSIAVYQNDDPTAGIFATVGNALFTSDAEVLGTVEDEPDTSGFGQREITVGPGDAVQIGAHQAIAGEVASLGDDQVRAIEVAISDFGEIEGHPVELQTEDDECSDTGVAGADRLVANPDIVGVVGTSCSGAARPSMAVYSEAGVILISGSNTAPDLTATGYLTEGALEQGESWVPGYFRTAHNDEFQGDGVGTFIFEGLGVTTLATIHDGDPYTEGLATEAGEAFEGLGGEVVLATSISAEDTDMRPVLTEVDASGAQALFFPIFQPAGDFVVRQAHEVFPNVITTPFGEL